MARVILSVAGVSGLTGGDAMFIERSAIHPTLLSFAATLVGSIFIDAIPTIKVASIYSEFALIDILTSRWSIESF